MLEELKPIAAIERQILDKRIEFEADSPSNFKKEKFSALRAVVVLLGGISCVA